MLGNGDFEIGPSVIRMAGGKGAIAVTQSPVRLFVVGNSYSLPPATLVIAPDGIAHMPAGATVPTVQAVGHTLFTNPTISSELREKDGFIELPLRAMQLSGDAASGTPDGRMLLRKGTHLVRAYCRGDVELSLRDAMGTELVRAHTALALVYNESAAQDILRLYARSLSEELQFEANEQNYYVEVISYA